MCWRRQRPSGLGSSDLLTQLRFPVPCPLLALDSIRATHAGVSRQGSGGRPQLPSGQAPGPVSLLFAFGRCSGSCFPCGLVTETLSCERFVHQHRLINDQIWAYFLDSISDTPSGNDFCRHPLVLEDDWE